MIHWGRTFAPKPSEQKPRISPGGALGYRGPQYASLKDGNRIGINLRGARAKEGGRVGEEGVAARGERA